MIVIDASAVLEILLQTEVGIKLRLAVRGLILDAPHLIDVEVVNALRRLAVSGRITTSQAERALDAFLEIPIRRYGHTRLVPQIWLQRHNLTAYDAAYVALAQVLGAEVLTMDAGVRDAAARKR